MATIRALGLTRPDDGWAGFLVVPQPDDLQHPVASGPSSSLTPYPLRVSATRITQSALDVLRCQQTLGPLVETVDGLRSPEGDLIYPIRDGLIFMGYDARQRDYISTVIGEEKDHQTSAENVARDTEFLQESAQAMAALTRALRRLRPSASGRRCLEVGAGSGWASYMFAEEGYDAWLCELEPNSLSISWLYDHPNMAAGKRIVSDATLVPFADETFDVVLCKEFAHHVADKEALFREANRVLKPDGLLVLFEPVRSVASAIYYARHPDPHTDHVIVWLHQYLRALRVSGFSVLERAPYHYRSGGRLPLVRGWRRRSKTRMHDGTLRHSLTDDALTYVAGAFLATICRKGTGIAQPPRPAIEIIDPALLTIGAAERERYRHFLDIIDNARRS